MCIRDSHGGAHGVCGGEDRVALRLGELAQEGEVYALIGDHIGAVAGGAGHEEGRDIGQDVYKRQMFLKLYMSVEPDICLLRRITRDINERGRSIENISVQYLSTVKPMYCLLYTSRCV